MKPIAEPGLRVAAGISLSMILAATGFISNHLTSLMKRDFSLIATKI
jgi:hypothetical protein